jgi:hypothetical protein
MFILQTIHSGFSTISTGVQSCVNGISSTGTIIETIHLLPCLHAILSHTSSFLVCDTNTLTCLNTQVGKLSQFSLFSISTQIIFQPCPDGNLSELSFTSFDLSQKIALSSLSSGDNSCSHFGVIFQTNISQPSTNAQILIIQSISKSFNLAGETFDISSVVCSGQSFVSLTSITYSLICTLVK